MHCMQLHVQVVNSMVLALNAYNSLSFVVDALQKRATSTLLFKMKNYLMNYNPIIHKMLGLNISYTI